MSGSFQRRGSLRTTARRSTTYSKEKMDTHASAWRYAAAETELLEPVGDNKALVVLLSAQ